MMIVPCESPDGSTVLVYPVAPSEMKEVILVKSVRCAEVSVVTVSGIVLEGTVIELLVSKLGDRLDEEEELDSIVVVGDIILVLVSRLELLLLAIEVEDEDKEVVAAIDFDEDVVLAMLLDIELELVLVVTEGGEEEEELDGIPTMTYPEFVPEAATVDVNPAAPAGICVVLVAYL